MNVNRVKVAHLLRELRATWRASHRIGIHARFRAAWLADKKFASQSGYRAALGRNTQAIAEGVDYV